MIALATELYKERMKNSRPYDDTSHTSKKPKKNPKDKDRGGQRPPLEQWRFRFDGEDKDDDGVEYVWCPHHGHKDTDGKQSGMYMPSPHDYDEWAKQRKEKRGAWETKRSKKVIPDGGGETTKPAGTLSLSKSFKSALTTHVNLSDEEAAFIMDKVEKEMKEEEEGK